MTFSQKQKQLIQHIIQSNEDLYNRILNDIYNNDIHLSKYDIIKIKEINEYFDCKDLKNYFDHNGRLKLYINNQIYPLYKQQIDPLLFQAKRKQALYELKQTKNLDRILEIIQQFDVKDQNLLETVYSKFKNNSDEQKLAKLVQRIENKRIKDEFLNSKNQQLSLFAKQIVKYARKFKNL